MHLRSSMDSLERRMLFAGDGLSARYFDNLDFTGPSVARVDATVNFLWGQGAPLAGISADTFSARWTGQVQAKYSQTYKFYVDANNGVRLWVNNKLLIDRWANSWGESSGSINLLANQKYDIKLEYYEFDNSANAKLSWSSSTQAKQVIPQAQLYSAIGTPVPPVPPAGEGNGLSVTYFNNVDFTGTRVTQVNTNIDKNWGNGSPSSDIVPDTFSARWSGLFQAKHSETYTFYTISDDGVRLWVNGKKLIDRWVAQSANQEFSGTIALVAGKKYDIRFEYYENTGQASAKLLYSSPSTPKAVIPASSFHSYLTRFAAIGDFGDDGPAEADVAQEVKSWAPDYVITVGDNNYPDGSASTIDRNIGKYYYEFIGNYTGIYGPGASENAFFPVPGNHDWRSPNLAAYRDYFTLPNNERYYDFVKGPTHFFALDSDSLEPSGNSDTSVQATWLKSKLAASTSPWNVVYFHHAPFASGSGEGSSPALQWPFRAWGADVVLAGHEHLYERIMKGDFAYFVNGLGGRNDFDQFGTPVSGSVARYNSDFGGMLIQAADDVITYQFINRAGTVIDIFTDDSP